MCATFGLLITMLSYEISVYRFRVAWHGRDGNDAMESNRFNAWYNHVIRYLTMATSIAGMIFFIKRKTQKTKWINSYLSHEYMFKKSKASMIM